MADVTRRTFLAATGASLLARCGGPGSVLEREERERCLEAKVEPWPVALQTAEYRTLPLETERLDVAQEGPISYYPTLGIARFGAQALDGKIALESHRQREFDQLILNPAEGISLRIVGERSPYYFNKFKDELVFSPSGNRFAFPIVQRAPTSLEEPLIYEVLVHDLKENRTLLVTGGVGDDTGVSAPYGFLDETRLLVSTRNLMPRGSEQYAHNQAVSAVDIETGNSTTIAQTAYQDDRPFETYLDANLRVVHTAADGSFFLLNARRSGPCQANYIETTGESAVLMFNRDLVETGTMFARSPSTSKYFSNETTLVIHNESNRIYRFSMPDLEPQPLVQYPYPTSLLAATDRYAAVEEGVSSFAYAENIISMRSIADDAEIRRFHGDMQLAFFSTAFSPDGDRFLFQAHKDEPRGPNALAVFDLTKA